MTTPDTRSDDQLAKPTGHLPVILPPSRSGGLIPLPNTQLLPSLVAAAGDQASWRYIDFFTANIRNPNTRRAYARACTTFFAWCDARGLGSGLNYVHHMRIAASATEAAKFRASLS